MIAFSNAQLEEMVRMHNDGKLNREIAIYFNTSTSTIGRQLKKLNVPSRHPRLSNKRIMMAIYLYEQCHNIAEVAKKINMATQTIKEILLSHNINIPPLSELKMLYQYDTHYFDEIDTANKAYFLGLLGSDGTIKENSNLFQLSLEESDKHIIEKLKQEIGYPGKLTFINYSLKNPNYSNQYCLSICNQQLHNALISHGVVPRKSYCYKFPYHLRPKFYSHYCRGVFDGDGSMGYKNLDSYLQKSANGRLSISITSTFDFCYGLADILEGLGIHYRVSDASNKNGITASLYIKRNESINKFLTWIYKDAEIFLKRKHDIYLKYKEIRHIDNSL